MLNQSKNRNLSIKEIPVCARQKVARLISPQTRQGRVEPDSFVARVWKQTTPPLHGLIFPFQGFPPGLQSWQCSYSTCSVSGAIIHKIWPSKPGLMSGKSQANVCPLVSIYGQILCFHGNSPRYRTYQAIINGPGCDVYTANIIVEWIEWMSKMQKKLPPESKEKQNTQTPVTGVYLSGWDHLLWLNRRWNIDKAFSRAARARSAIYLTKESPPLETKL